MPRREESGSEPFSRKVRVQARNDRVPKSRQQWRGPDGVVGAIREP